MRSLERRSHMSPFEKIYWDGTGVRGFKQDLGLIRGYRPELCLGVHLDMIFFVNKDVLIYI